MRVFCVLKITVGICLILSLCGLAAPIASAQPANDSNPQFGVAVTAGTDAEPLITLRASETSAATILSLIAAKTGAKIIIKKDAPLEYVEVKRQSLSEAIAQIAKAANLKFEAEGPPGSALEATYIVSEIEARPNFKSPSVLMDMDFKEISAAQLVNLLTEQFGIKARVDPQASEKMVDIMMFNATAIEALQMIADAADLEINKTTDGYILKERAAKRVEPAQQEEPAT